jgi:hypothetical protein
MGLDRPVDLPAAAVGGSISYRPVAKPRERS